MDIQKEVYLKICWPDGKGAEQHQRPNSWNVESCEREHEHRQGRYVGLGEELQRSCYDCKVTFCLRQMSDGMDERTRRLQREFFVIDVSFTSSQMAFRQVEIFRVRESIHDRKW